MAPDQVQHLEYLFHDEEETEEDLEETLGSIMEGYQSISNSKWKLFLLSLVPDRYTNEESQKLFNCKRY